MPKQVDSESHPVRRDSFTDIPLADSNGGIVLSIGLVAGLAAFIFLVTTHFPLIFVLPVGLPTVIILVAIVKGLVVVKPNESLVCLLFGRYVGTEHQPGLWWVNPFCERKKTSRRLFTLECGPLKVNDAVGNPVDIGAVIIWRVEDAARATLEVQSYKDYVEAQSEAALRRLASTHPYDDVELETVHGDGHPKRAISTITLRDGGDEIIAPLLRELQVRMSAVGVVVLEARISHLAYASEIAGAMLRKQAASAVLAARRMVVRGAVGIVADALQELESKHLSDGLDAERKAAMVSNLLVVLVGDRDVSPVINTGTLYS